MSNAQRRVVVTGMGAVTPIGLSVEDYWDAMMRSESGIASIESFDAEQYTTRFGGELPDAFDAEDYLGAKDARRMDPFCHYAIAASDAALADAGIDPDDEDSYHVSPFFIPMMIPDMASGQLSMRYNFRGPNYCIVSACATGNNNIGDAYMLIQQGTVDAALCGGTEACITPLGLAGFGSMRALSTRNDDPEHASRPFDADRDGFVMGDGSGAFFIESLQHARERDAEIHAEIVGIGMSADAHHITAPDPEGDGAALAMNGLLESGGLEAEDVDYLNMHGTSTPLGDVAETKAIKRVFGDHAYQMNTSSTKSMTGHLLGAAGAVEAIAAIGAIQNDTVPPTINFETEDPECDLNYTFNEPQEREVTVAVSNAFGFGGHNTSIAFREFDG
ncbi:MAG: beta-ketoacyl-[acyl-carrier-protein] synthase II [Bacteroidetes bacterium QH_8_67_23]|nr:MAG: beta-ketoacyl-[acyl-carrier-protein] synthase II [Bacteroidetes bacterium QH_8_67_23]